MKRWTSVPFVTRCGVCRAEIPANATVVMLSFPEVKRALYRCESCAGPRAESVAMMPVEPYRPMFTLARKLLATLPKDGKALAIGLEPGEDDD